MSTYHKSVLLNETIDLLGVKKGKKYIDATLGGGGHARRILELGGQVLGIDRDQDAIEFASKELEEEIKLGKLKVTKGNFVELDKIALSQNFNNVAGVIFDLGVSSHQLEDKSRGFSFLGDGPLDMRMDKEGIFKAEEIVNLKTKEELYEIFSKLGEEHNARAISHGIVSARRIKAIQTTEDLARVVEKAYGFKRKAPDFVRGKILNRVFQALRIAVNNELENLNLALLKTISILESKGKVAVISFHSLEDRIVKYKFLDFEKNNLGRIITDKPITPSFDEIKENRRSKSSKLRVFEKL